MDRRRYLGAIAGVVAIAGCGAPSDTGDGTAATDVEEIETATSTATPTETPAGDGRGELTINMETEGTEYYFDPIGLFVEVGETVTFRIASGSHSSTAYHEDNDAAEATRIPEDAEPWHSGTLSEAGATFDTSFETAGTYDYFCVPHKSLEMVGRIVVEEPGGPAEGSMPPDGDVPESDAVVEEGSVAYEDFVE